MVHTGRQLPRPSFGPFPICLLGNVLKLGLEGCVPATSLLMILLLMMKTNFTVKSVIKNHISRVLKLIWQLFSETFDALDQM